MNLLRDFIKRETSNIIQELDKLPPEIEKLLGKMSDRELANKFGIHRKIILKARQARSIPPYTKEKKLQPTESFISMLGKASDNDLAKAFNVSKGTVYRMRTAAGIEPYGDDPFVKINKTKDQEKLALIKYLHKTKKIDQHNIKLYLELSDKTQHDKLIYQLLKPVLDVKEIYVYHETRNDNKHGEFTVFIYFDETFWKLFTDVNMKHFEDNIPPGAQLTIRRDSVSGTMIIFNVYEIRAQRINLGTVSYTHENISGFYKLILNFITLIRKATKELSDNFDTKNLTPITKTSAQPAVNLSPSSLKNIGLEKEF